ncbi:serine O-acetyltransferase [Kocuria rosea]|uniref:serine O-acetyltransferase n=1 Tax=Kocuria rosea TaxID=1275 RepID=UPI000692254D|nr:serine O-acetyltransferase [Kocuria polaris]
MQQVKERLGVSAVWEMLRESAASPQEPSLEGLMRAVVAECDSFEQSLSGLMAHRIADEHVTREDLVVLFTEALAAEPAIAESAAVDLLASVARNPAYPSVLVPYLFAKGFLGLQVHRVAHHLWHRQRPLAAMFLQSRVSEVFSMDIHPGAAIGSGVFIDHATGVVIGETAVVGDDVSILQNVTLGGTGKQTGDRHPKIGSGVLLSAGAKVLGNVAVGDGAKVGAGSVVLAPVPAGTTAVGVPARVVRCRAGEPPAESMDQSLDYMI